MRFVHLSIRLFAVVMLALSLSVSYQTVHAQNAPGLENQVNDAMSDETASETASEAGEEQNADPDEGFGSITVTERGTFELHAVNQSINDTLRQLAFQSQRNIVATPNVDGNVTFDLYDVTLEQALNAMMIATGLTYIEQDGFIYVMTREEKDEIIKSNIPIETRVFELAFLTASDAQNLVQPALSDIAKVTSTPPSSVGIAQSSDSTGGDSHAADNLLVVTDYQPNLNRVAAIIEQMDIRPQQVLVEATILKATLTENDALGVNISVLFNQTFADLVTSGANPLPFLQSSTSDSFNLQDGANLGNATTTSGAPGGAFGTNLTGNFPSDVGAVSVGVLTDNVAAFIKAIESVRDVTVIANPKLLIVNKQRGEILIGRQEGYLTTTVTETSATQTVEFLETGTRLLVRPFVGRNGVIRMEIHPEDSSSDLRVIGEVNPTVVPNKDTTELTSNIMVRDGRTIVIGGLFRDSITLDRRQMPGVGDVPFVGDAFRSTADTVEREEVIILLTPHIVDFPAAEAVSEQAKDDVERYRIGARRGLQWWSRSRMADNYYHWAKRDYAAGNMDSAKYNIDMALTADPKFIDAIQLKEKMTGEAFWANSPRHVTMRYFVEKMMLQEMGVDANTVMPPGQPLDVNRIDPDVRRVLGIEEKPTRSGLLPKGQTAPGNMTVQPPGLPAYESENYNTDIRELNNGPAGGIVEQIIEQDTLNQEAETRRVEADNTTTSVIEEIPSTNNNVDDSDNVPPGETDDIDKENIEEVNDGGM